jgi:hypothetical protein
MIRRALAEAIAIIAFVLFVIVWAQVLAVSRI